MYHITCLWMWCVMNPLQKQHSVADVKDVGWTKFGVSPSKSTMVPE